MQSRTPKKKEQTQKDLPDKITHVVEELKKTQSQGSFLHWMESLKNGKCVLEKSLNFLFKKGDEPWKSERSVRVGDSEKRFAACSIRTRLRFQFAANLFARPKKVASYADLTML